jgi:hypothetical protein
LTWPYIHASYRGTPWRPKLDGLRILWTLEYG